MKIELNKYPYLLTVVNRKNEEEDTYLIMECAKVSSLYDTSLWGILSDWCAIHMTDDELIERGESAILQTYGHWEEVGKTPYECGVESIYDALERDGVTWTEDYSLYLYHPRNKIRYF